MTISSVSVAPTSAAGAASGWTIDFTTSSGGALAIGNQVNITFPTGTSFNFGSFSSALTLVSNGVTVGSSAGYTGTTFSFSVSKSIPASTALSAFVAGVVNPAEGSYPITMTTTTDAGTATSPTNMTIGPASKIASTPSVTVSPTTATSALTGYGLTFTTSSTGAMAGVDGASMNVTLPTGFAFTGSSPIASTVTDLTTGDVVSPYPSVSGQKVTFQLSQPANVHPGDMLRAWLYGVTNPSSVPGTAPSFSVSTTSDTTPILSGPITITAANPVSGVNISNTGSTSAANSLTNYTVTFKTSATGGLADNDGSKITVTFPSGFNATGLGSYGGIAGNQIVDVTTGVVVGTVAGSANIVTGTVTGGGYSGGASVNGGDVLRLVMDGIQNGAAASADTVKVSTTSDNATPLGTSNTFPVKAQAAVGTPTLSIVGSKAENALSSWTATFKLSTIGGLSGSSGAYATVVLPTGASYNDPAGASPSTLIDTTTGQNLNATFSQTTTGQIQALLGNGAVANPGDVLVMTLFGVGNPSATSASVTVFTSSDKTSAASKSVTLVAQEPVSGVSITSMGPAKTAGALTGYRVNFKVSSVGALSQAAGSSVTITFPSGFGGSATARGTLIDTTTGQTVGTLVGNGGTLVTAVLDNGAVVNAGNALEALVYGMTNGVASTTYTVTVGTSSDLTSIASNTFTVGTATKLTSVALVASAGSPTDAAGATTSYRLTFNIPSGAAMNPTNLGSVTIGLPNGFSAGQTSGIVLFDKTSGQTIGLCLDLSSCSGGLSIPITQPVNAGDVILATVNGVVNGVAGTTGKFTVATSSSPGAVAISNATDVVTAEPVSAVTVSSGTPTTASYGLTGYTVSFTTSSIGALSPSANSWVTVGLPGSFKTGNNVGYVVTDTKTNTVLASCTVGNYCYWYSGDPIYVQSPAAAGDTITVSLSGIVNGPASTTDTITAWTSSDPSNVKSADFTVVAAQAVTTPSVTVSPTAAAGGVTGWIVNFTASSTGGLSGDVGSYINVYVPTNTGSPCSSYFLFSQSTLNDVTTNTQVAVNLVCPQDNLVTFQLDPGTVVNPGDHLELHLNGMQNPANPKSYKLLVRTSSDMKQVASLAFTIVAPNTISTPKLTRSNSTHGASSTYTVTFTVSKTGGLSGTVGSAIYLLFPPGTGVNGASATVTDVTTNEQVANDYLYSYTGSQLYQLPLSQYDGASVAAGDTLSVVLSGLTNPPAGSYTMEVSTTSDWYQESTAPFTIS
ncbi:MAG: beta strand repeat-containing protein [Acidimicrobiales bacterium]